MVRIKKTIHQRAEYFKDDKFYVSDKTILMCGFCDCRLEWEKQDTLTKHVKSAGHVKKKEACVNGQNRAPKRQATIPLMEENAKKAKSDKKAFIEDTVKMCLKSNIPLNKMDHPAVREYLKKYVPGSGDLPKADTLRGTHLSACADEIREDIKTAIQDKPVVIVADETSDCKGRCALAILYRTVTPTASQEVFLGTCAFLDSANSTTVSRAILDSAASYGVNWDNVLGVVSDSAPYMKACFTALNVVAGDHLLHFTCWAHKVNLAGDIFMKTLKELNLFVTKTKMAFLNARKMKSAYLNFLRATYPDLKAKLFPSPVITRWNTWFHAVVYLDEYFVALVAFLRGYEAKNPSIDFILELFDDPGSSAKITIQMKFVAEVCQKFISLINDLEGSKYPYAHLLWDELQSLAASLKRLSDGAFPIQTVTKLGEVRNAVARSEIKKGLQECGLKSATKLASHMTSTTANRFYEAAGCLFNPAIAGQSVPLNDQSLKSSKAKLATFGNVSDDVFLDSYHYFHRQLTNQMKEGVDVNIVQLLLAVKFKHAEFAESALKTIWAPVNSVDAERFFSNYNLVLTDRRTNMKEDTVETCAMLNFNQMLW